MNKKREESLLCWWRKYGHTIEFSTTGTFEIGDIVSFGKEYAGTADDAVFTVTNVDDNSITVTSGTGVKTIQLLL